MIDIYLSSQAGSCNSTLFDFEFFDGWFGAQTAPVFGLLLHSMADQVHCCCKQECRSL